MRCSNQRRLPNGRRSAHRRNFTNACLWNILALHSPSPQPSPQGEGATLPYAEVRNRSDDERGRRFPPLLGEGVGVRGNVIGLIFATWVTHRKQEPNFSARRTVDVW